MKNLINVETDFDVVIAGAGPAGLSAGIYIGRSGLNVLILEKTVVGGKVIYTYEIENYPGFKKVDGFTLAKSFEEQALALGAKIEYSGLKSFEKTDIFNITLENGRVITSKVLILATGTKENHLGVPGEKEYYGKGVSYCATCDGPGPRFKDKPIVVVGGGYSAIEEGNYLTRFGSVVHIVHRRKQFRVDTKSLKKAEENPKIVFHYDSVVEEITGTANEGVTGVRIKNVLTNEVSEIKAVGVFPFIGQNPVVDYITDTNLLNQDKQIVADINMQTSIEGLFTAGDVRNTPFRQIATAVADGALAGQNAVRYIENLD
ncbi:thioredoxin reductase [Spiroplasma clarkii]|uniref:Thioredoxin reductase n=1 Tax=Spiroplasma clarkii TaxID=2139 RepID=A0A1Y0L3P2_9MOLU|nr:FAD-dependent oxidoreductase [Spiroplasma clarkii]ARU92299.1 thioredoxin reductase [Spiroplasma clarkii]ATX71609.1 thioredoxin reductase [Spiroplasma clarkii]